jgi:vibriolysin
MRCPHRTRRCSPLAVVLAAACGTDPVNAPIVTEPVRHVETGAAQVSGDLQRAAIDYARSVIGADLSSGDDFVVRAARTGKDGLHHIRLQQVHRDVPVRASEIVVHADESTFISLNGTVTRNLEGFDVTATVNASAAMAVARQDHAAGTQATGEIQVLREKSGLVIMPGEDGQGATLVWQLEFFTEFQPSVPPGRWFYFVDARTGDILDSYNGLTTAQGSGPGGNPRVTRSWNAQLDVEPGGDGYVMDTDRFATYDMENAPGVVDVEAGLPEVPLPELAVTSSSLDFEDPIVNDIHGHTEIALDMMQRWMGFDSIDGKGYKLVSRAHYGIDLANAFWDGATMGYGDGDIAMNAYPMGGALDIVAHEISHGFTEFHSNLDYRGMPGSLNESFSDVAGIVARFFQDGEGATFDFGGDILVEGDAIRYLCDPTQDHAFYAEHGYPELGSLDHVNDFERDSYIHMASGIGNKAFCLSVGRLKATSGSSTTEAVRRLGRVWFEANASYWTSGTTFVQGCQGTIDAAHALGFSREDVTHIVHSWADVGVVCGEEPLVCNNNGACDVVSGETCFSCSADCGACAESCGWFKRAKCKIGLGDCTECPEERGCGDGLCQGDEDDVSCPEDCGCGAADSCGSIAPFGCFCDAECSSSGDCCADIDVCR